MDKIQRATEINSTMTPHQMALRIVELEDSSADSRARVTELLEDRNATGVAIDSATRGILPESHPMLIRLQMIANMAKRITELQDALELAEEAVRAKHVPSVLEGWQLVPKVPTRDMIDQGNAAMAYDCCSGDASDAYQAMLSSAPKLWC